MLFHMSLFFTYFCLCVHISRSPWSGFPCTLDIFVTQVQELLEMLDIADDGVEVLGYSLGGAVGIGFSVKFPHLCRSLCLIDPAGIRLKNPAKYVCQIAAVLLVEVVEFVVVALYIIKLLSFKSSLVC